MDLRAARARPAEAIDRAMLAGRGTRRCRWRQIARHRARHGARHTERVTGERATLKLNSHVGPSGERNDTSPFRSCTVSHARGRSAHGALCLGRAASSLYARPLAVMVAAAKSAGKRSTKPVERLVQGELTRAIAIARTPYRAPHHRMPLDQPATSRPRFTCYFLPARPSHPPARPAARAACAPPRTSSPTPRPPPGAITTTPTSITTTTTTTFWQPPHP